MKTAEEALKDKFSVYTNESEHECIDDYVEDFIQVMKDYGRQVAEQALKDAANKMKVRLDLCLDDYLDIVETPILTP